MEPESSPLTTHVLDTASGLPACGLRLHLSRLEDLSQQWTELKKRQCSSVPTIAPLPAQPRLTRGGQTQEGRGKLALHLISAAHPLPSYTDLDGRCPGLLRPGQMKPGTYKLSFETQGYWNERGQESFYPYIEVVFTITKETQKFHVPLLLSPWSYTTYRGS
ncbi:5-hydroxyisourate hydrolase-like isoform X1 [Marmota marmota marmota]|uniref:5-hydroxyisourate hydrolase-like isoform X1 n=1 Tax=Marmota marmota marmota TaxID=9994 RepID=UPI002093EC86|nr:5-hydroxyisourate hydrolase-like isoform X1 [Marmota marmota marmota]